MYMNKQTSEMLKILLNSPGQYFTCEALAEYLHVSIRTIRNYMTTIRDFMNQNGKEALLQQSEGGICVTGTAEELWLHIGTENPWTLILLMLKLIGSHILLVIRITRA